MDVYRLVIVNEMVHDARIVPLGTGAHLADALRFWSGNSRGRREGITLVVETRTFTNNGARLGHEG